MPDARNTISTPISHISTQHRSRSTAWGWRRLAGLMGAVAIGITALAVTPLGKLIFAPPSFAAIGDSDGRSTFINGAAFAPPGPIVVNTLADHPVDGCQSAPGDCTLREAITSANNNFGADTIQFANNVVGTIDLTASLPVITEGVSIEGPGEALLTVRRSSGGDYRIFHVTAAANIYIYRMTIADGKVSGPSPGGDGAGILNAGNGSLFLVNLLLTNNFATRGGGIANTGGGTVNLSTSTVFVNSGESGGGIYNKGTLSVANSTLRGNNCDYGCGIYSDDNSSLLLYQSTVRGNYGYQNGGGVYVGVNSKANVINSTISGNHAGLNCGAIENAGGQVKIVSSTIANNNAFGCGGINGPATLRSSIVIGNVSVGRGNDLVGSFVSEGHNVVGPRGNATITPTTGDQFGVTEQQVNLGPIVSNGGPTETHALLSPSVAIDAGADCVAEASHCGDPLLLTLTTDQRGAGYARNVNHVDAGAFEVQPACANGKEFQDPGLEASSDDGSNPFWITSSTNFGTAICSVAACGSGSNGEAVPRTGAYWAWFGGVDGPETSTLSQKFKIPANGKGYLRFYLKVSRVYAPFTDTLKINVDGNTLQTITEPSSEVTFYLDRSINLDTFADGVEHTLTFEFTSPSGGKASSFNVDDIVVNVTCTSTAPTPTPTPTVTPTPTPTPPSCSPGNRVQDTSLEQSSVSGPPFTNPFWTSNSTNFGSAICKSSVCGSGSNGQAVPRTGNYWAWFGGVPGPEVGTLSQKVKIPAGTGASLSYWLKVSKVYSPYQATLKVKIDGTVVQIITEPHFAEAAYTQKAVNIGAYADGAEHTIVFEFNSPQTKTPSFNVDDIQLNVTCSGASMDDTFEPEVKTRDVRKLLTDHVVIGGEFSSARRKSDEPEFEKSGLEPDRPMRMLRFRPW